MDITSLFKACVEVAKKQNKELETIIDQSTSTSTDSVIIKNGCLPFVGKSNSTTSKSKLFPGKKTEYYSQARDLLTSLTGLRKYLLEVRSPYLNIGSHNEENNIKSTFSKNSNHQKINELTNSERDQVDQDVQQIIQKCQKRIFEFQKMIETTGAEQKQPQLYIHLENISISLGVYLKEICTFYSEMRAIRVKRTIDFKAMSKLSTTSAGSSGGNSNNTNTNNNSNFLKNTIFKNSSSEDIDGGGGKKLLPHKSSETNNKKTSTSILNPQIDIEYQMSSGASAYFEDDDELTPEEIQILEAENVQLYNELNSLSNEVDSIQTSVVKIAQLQTIFTEKILQQDKDMEKIITHVVGATENIKGGNEQIRQAIQQSADFRAWVLFFIIVMSLSLLFLDWYND